MNMAMGTAFSPCCNSSSVMVSSVFVSRLAQASVILKILCSMLGSVSARTAFDGYRVAVGPGDEHLDIGDEPVEVLMARTRDQLGGNGAWYHDPVVVSKSLEHPGDDLGRLLGAATLDDRARWPRMLS